MGNSIHGVNLLSDVRYFPYHAQLGKYAAIDVTEEERKENDGGHHVTWKVSYTTIDGSTCELNFRMILGKDRSKVNSIHFTVRHDIEICYHLCISKDKTNHLEVRYRSGTCNYGDMSYNSPRNNPSTTTVHAQGSATHTDVYSYGSGSKRALVVLECKNKSGDENSYMVTVAHYYATSSGNFSDETGKDIGLSVIIKAQPSNDKKGMDITVEGPAHHPARALIIMFDQVRRNGTWKPTACPHCAFQRQPYSESESGDRNNLLLPAAPLHGTSGQNARGGFLNNKDIMGNNNGNIYAGREVRVNYIYGEHKPHCSETRTRQHSGVSSQSKSHETEDIKPPVSRRSTELIDNEDINGNGNGNRIGRDQDSKVKIPISLWKRAVIH